MKRVTLHLPAAALEALRAHGRLEIELRCRPDRGGELQARVAELLAADPTASANDVHRVLGGRRGDVLRAVRSVRASEAKSSPVPGPDGAPTRFLSPGYHGGRE